MIKKALLVLACLGVLSACADSPEEATDKAKHKPALPTIIVYNDDGSPQHLIYRLCDGTTLLYVREAVQSGIAAVPNSPLCGGSAK